MLSKTSCTWSRAFFAAKRLQRSLRSLISAKSSKANGRSLLMSFRHVFRLVRLGCSPFHWRHRFLDRFIISRSFAFCFILFIRIFISSSSAPLDSFVLARHPARFGLFRTNLHIIAVATLRFTCLCWPFFSNHSSCVRRFVCLSPPLPLSSPLSLLLSPSMSVIVIITAAELNRSTLVIVCLICFWNRFFLFSFGFFSCLPFVWIHFFPTSESFWVNETSPLHDLDRTKVVAAKWSLFSNSSAQGNDRIERAVKWNKFKSDHQMLNHFLQLTDKWHSNKRQQTARRTDQPRNSLQQSATVAGNQKIVWIGTHADRFRCSIRSKRMSWNNRPFFGDRGPDRTLFFAYKKMRLYNVFSANLLPIVDIQLDRWLCFIAFACLPSKQDKNKRKAVKKDEDKFKT